MNRFIVPAGSFSFIDEDKEREGGRIQSNIVEA
jgi:hypothetical protein